LCGFFFLSFFLSLQREREGMACMHAKIRKCWNRKMCEFCGINMILWCWYHDCYSTVRS
jgi:hypothetical protein